MRFEADRRTNEHDLPKPEKIEHEWIILKDGYIYGAISWPDTPEGRHQATLVANALNSTYAQGRLDTQAEIRAALGCNG